MDETRLHACTIVWREDGFLIRGVSGSGKTALASAFVAEGRRCGVFSRLVADDVVCLRAHGGRLVARPHERIAGLIERRGVGVLPIDHEPACVVRLILDLEANQPARLPEPTTQRVPLLGIILPRLALWRDAPAADNVYRAIDFFAAFRACS